jgi:RNA ligase
VTMEFQEFGKIARLNRSVVITEKIDGTNAQIHIRPGLNPNEFEFGTDVQIHVDCAGVQTPSYIRAGSRSRWLSHGVSKDGDNYGFARWVHEHAHELAALGYGAHYGEWWGKGIQRGYDVPDKRFSLFNIARWGDPAFRPACCGVVPVLAYSVGFDLVKPMIEDLRTNGSRAAGGFMKPEGIVMFHTATQQLFKATLERDEEPKSFKR